jgi:NAD(P)-dependent dehydrogenase (short-subunit alcohol dehydrogenase family)
MAGVCAGRSVIITGAGQGLGRAHALEFARQGARLVLNDLGPAVDEVAAEIRAQGGEAVVSQGDVSDWEYAGALVQAAVDAYGQLDTLVNNAGINRDRMLVNMSEAEWDLVLKVDLKGHFAPMRHAAAYWRDKAKAGEPIAARVVNTSSGAGLMGSVGQGNYAAAKAGIAVLTQLSAVEWARYGIVVNAIAPSARTPMTEGVFAESMAKPETGFDTMHPANVSPLVAWLGSDKAEGVTGKVFEIAGGELSVTNGWQHGTPAVKDARWEADELGPVIAELIAKAPAPAPVYGA